MRWLPFATCGMFSTLPTPALSFGNAPVQRRGDGWVEMLATK